MTADADIPYARELLRLAKERATGILAAVYGEQRREVHMREGRVAFATTSLDTERIGRLLVRSGDLEDKDVSEAVASATDSDALIGQWLVAQERITRAKLQWGLRQQCERVTCASFAWPAAELAFDERVEEPRGFQDFSLPVTNLVLEGSRRFLPPALAIDVLNGIGERCELAENFDEVLREVRIGPEEERVLGLLDGKRTADEIARLTLLDVDDVYKITAGFALVGAIQVPAPRPLWDRPTDRIDVTVWDQETDPEGIKPRNITGRGQARTGMETAKSAETARPPEPNTDEHTLPREDATPVAVPDTLAIARDALPGDDSILTLDDEKATASWREQLDTSTESLLVWFDGQRTVGEILELLEEDEDSVVTIARLVRDGYLSVAGNGTGTHEPPQPRTAAEELQSLQAMAPKDAAAPVDLAAQPAADEASESSAEPDPDDEGSMAGALLQQADRLVAAGARAVDAGNYGHAARFFQRALRKSPDHADALLGLGTSRYGMNDRSGARIAWESFLRVEPDGALSDRIRSVIDDL